MKFLNGILVIAVFALMTACGGGATTENTDDATTDTAAAKPAETEKKNEETTSTETQAPAALLTAGKWMMDAEAMIATLPEDKRPKTDEEKQKLAEKAKQVTMQFNADGTYVGMRGDNETKGTWTLSEDGKTLTTQEEGKEKKEVLNVTEMSADKMVFEVGEGEQKSVITMIPFKGESTETKEGETVEMPKKEGEHKDGGHK